MDKFEINKLIAAIVLTVVIVLGINKLADIVYSVKSPKDSTYKIATTNEIEKTNKEDDLKTEGAMDIKAFLALGSVDHGKIIYKQCAACHSISKGGGNKIGPALWGIIGRKAGSLSNYKYSKGMAGLDKIWNFIIIVKDHYYKGQWCAYLSLKIKFNNIFFIRINNTC